MLSRLFRRTPPATPSLLETIARDSLLVAIAQQLLCLDAGLGLFRLAHLLDALARSPNPRPCRLISIGSGGGLHEAFLARLFPGTEVIGCDLRAPHAGVSLPNLSFRQCDLLDPAFTESLPGADFVCSIECLEHIDEDETVAAAMASLVRPGGSLYIEVPFATDAELTDPAIVREHFEAHEHVRPGYSPSRLEELCRRSGLRVSHIAGAFWFPMQPMVWFGMTSFGESRLIPHWREFLALAMLDVRQELPEHRLQATAIKVLAVKPGSDVHARRWYSRISA